MPKARVYYGWFLVPMTILATTCLVGITTSAFGLFVVPVSRDLGLSRAEMNTAIILLSIGFAMGAPVVGYMLDRMSIRRIMIVSSVIFGASLVALGESNSIWLSVAILLFPLSFSYMGAGGLTSPALMARWFSVNRGRAMTLSAMGLSAGSVVVVPTVAVLIDRFGWRLALVSAGIGIGAILFVIALFVRNAPGPDDIETPRAANHAGTPPRPAAPLEPPRSFSDLARSPALWVIAFTFGMTTAVTKAVLVSMVPIALANGISTTQAASLIAATGTAGICGKLILAWFADRVDRILFLAGGFLLIGLVNLLLLFSEGYVVLLLTAILLGVATAAFAPLFAALLADRFGAGSFGTTKGLVAPLNTVLGAIMIRYAGEVYDRTGNYDVFFQTAILTQIVVAAMMLQLRFTQRRAAMAA